MAKVVDPRNLPDPRARIPGLKPPVFEFTPCDDSDASEADAFNKMIRELRNQNPASARTPDESPSARYERGFDPI
jgi:hypothetical protein